MQINTVKDIIASLESFAHPKLQEAYDNSGLQVGNPNKEVSGVLVSLDCTEEIVLEAINKKCNLIVCHHPVLFKGLKNITGKNYVEKTIITAIKNDIAIYAIHTNLDNIQNGVNALFADKLGLSNPKILAPKTNTQSKIITYSPVKNAQNIRKALFNAGCGTIGNYEQCSFNNIGEGTYKANELANPYKGKVNELHAENEVQISVLTNNYNIPKAISALKQAHPYEEVAYDIVSIANTNPEIGSGMIGEIVPTPLFTFLEKIKTTLNCSFIKHTQPITKHIKKVAICGGSGHFLTPIAIAAQADIYITSDIKYHEFFDANQQIVLVDVGHYESEQFTKELLFDIINKNFSTFAVHISEINTNPVNYL